MPTILTRNVLVARLSARGEIDAEFAPYLLAACDPADGLGLLLAGGPAPSLPVVGEDREVPVDVPPTYLSAIQIRAFRGIGGDAALGLPPGPGVTLVVGRNGSGKSSFAEGAEVAFTGTSVRWKDRGSVEWVKGWRNVHAALAPRIVVELLQQGVRGVTRLERTWADQSDDVQQSSAQLIDTGRKRRAFGDASWAGALDRHRPFLSYSELGSMLSSGPSKVYQALLAGLGLDDLVQVRDALAGAVGEQKRLWDTSRKAADALAARAATLADANPEESRLTALAHLLRGRSRDIDAIAALVTGTSDGAGGDLDALVSLQPPVTPERLAEVVRELRDAAQARQALQTEATGLMLGVSRVLREALAVAQAAPQDRCPVCESDVPLDAVWQARAQTRLGEIDTLARAAHEGEQRVMRAVDAARALGTAVPAALAQAPHDALPSAAAAVDAWTRWAALRAEKAPDRLAEALERVAPELTEALAALVAEARTEAARRDTIWRPFAMEVAEWVRQAPAAAAAREHEKRLTKARDWMSVTIDEERQARFAPVKAQAIEFWNLIAQQSSVMLEDIELSGQGNLTKVTLKVTVDGKEAPALGVLSQGELNAMTLSLFLPRVLLPATPFGFVVVDDPVQAMDEVRVDGLAHVLARVGESRQVIVFTHDARLPEAFERLALPHAKRRVTRGIESSVVVSPLIGPWEQRLNDARDVTLTPDLPVEIAGRVVPGFCRLALEAACIEVLRRHWLQAGQNHADVEKRLSRRGLRELLALLFAGDARLSDVVEPRLRRCRTRDAAALVKDCQDGAHAGFDGDLTRMVERTRALCDELRKVVPA